MTLAMQQALLSSSWVGLLAKSSKGGSLTVSCKQQLVQPAWSLRNVLYSNTAAVQQPDAASSSDPGAPADGNNLAAANSSEVAAASSTASQPAASTTATAAEDSTSASAASVNVQHQSSSTSTTANTLPLETLRVQLRVEKLQEVVEAKRDAYSLSRSMVGDVASPQSTATTAAQQQWISTADREVLGKLVGILTKDGKKSRARRILLDAMHIIQQQLAKGAGTA